MRKQVVEELIQKAEKDREIHKIERDFLAAKIAEIPNGEGKRFQEMNIQLNRTHEQIDFLDEWIKFLKENY